MRGTSTCEALMLLVLLACLASFCSAQTPNDILEHNSARRDDARLMSAILYSLIVIGFTSMTVLLGILLGWLWPFPLVYKVLNSKGPKSVSYLTGWNTFIWCFVLICISLITTVAGMPGWMVLGFTWFVACLCIGIVSCVVSANYKTYYKTASQVAPDAENGETVQRQLKTDACRAHPMPLSRGQLIATIILGVLMVACLVAVLALFYTWDISEYKLWDLENSTEIVEVIPSNTGKAIMMMYAWEGLASDLRYGIYAKITTSYCGNSFRADLKDDKAKEKQIKIPFIDAYSIDMSIFEYTDYRRYNSTNHWFIRRITQQHLYRPVSDSVPLNCQIISPADARMLIFPNFETQSKVWIKGEFFNLRDLVEDNEDMITPFENGTMVLARLAPQDYHRFNSPLGANATILKIRSVGGSYWSVNPDAVISGNGAFYNLRQLVLLSHPTIGKVAYIAIGATCVGSVVLNQNLKEGSVIGAYTEMGFMQFGGSTVMMLFEKNKGIQFDNTLLENSRLPVESYVKVNSLVGQAPTC